jgi:hypothetical protein
METPSHISDSGLEAVRRHRDYTGMRLVFFAYARGTYNNSISRSCSMATGG